MTRINVPSQSHIKCDPNAKVPFLEENVNLGSLSMGDLCTAMHRVHRNPILLETSIPNGNSILVWNPVAVISGENERVKVGLDENVHMPVPPKRPEEIPRYIQKTIDNYRINLDGNTSEEHPFVGGFVGFVGYEWMVRQEITSQKTENGVPDIWFGLYDRAIVRDNRNQTKLLAFPHINGTTLKDIRTEFKAAMSGVVLSHQGAETAGSLTLLYDFPREGYERGVREVKKAIRSGDVYQANIAQRIRTTGVDPFSLYKNLNSLNPSPFSGILSAGEFTIVSASPERLLKVWSANLGDKWISTRPIAGTRPRGSGTRDSELERSLRRSPKELAEHTMLVDLSRNDVGRVAIPGSVEVSELYTVERYSHVMHLVSEVRGRLSESVGIAELFRALFPGGSITGTPKIRSTEIITDIEPIPRGAYTGSMGYISLDGTMDFNILIRSAFFPRNQREMHLYAGSGIVQDSNPTREWEETRAKAAALLEAANGSESGGAHWTPPHLSSSWRQEIALPRFNGSKVLLIDNYDSFTYNIVQYLSTLGADVMVFRNDSATISELKKTRPTHVILSPGPGIPEEAGITLEAVRAFENYPVFGVCLGHQAIVQAYGGTLKKARLPMHGKTSKIVRTKDSGKGDLLWGMPENFIVGRYHSIVANEVPTDLAVTAQSLDGEIMAIQHRDLPTYGVQFHPESILTQHGMQIFSNFLTMKKIGEAT